MFMFKEQIDFFINFETRGRFPATDRRIGGHQMDTAQRTQRATSILMSTEKAVCSESNHVIDISTQLGPYGDNVRG